MSCAVSTFSSVRTCPLFSCSTIGSPRLTLAFYQVTPVGVGELPVGGCPIPQRNARGLHLFRAEPTLGRSAPLRREKAGSPGLTSYTGPTGTLPDPPSGADYGRSGPRVVRRRDGRPPHSRHAARGAADRERAGPVDRQVPPVPGQLL